MELKKEQERSVVTIIVNGQPHEVEKEDITFEDLVNLAYNNNPPQGENWCFTVTYRRGHGNKEGILTPGEAVKVKEGMIFNVTATDKS